MAPLERWTWFDGSVGVNSTAGCFLRWSSTSASRPPLPSRGSPVRLHATGLVAGGWVESFFVVVLAVVRLGAAAFLAAVCLVLSGIVVSPLRRAARRRLGRVGGDGRVVPFVSRPAARSPDADEPRWSAPVASPCPAIRVRRPLRLGPRRWLAASPATVAVSSPSRTGPPRSGSAEHAETCAASTACLASAGWAFTRLRLLPVGVEG